MLGVGRYLVGVAELGLIAGFAWLGAAVVRRRLVPALAGAPAHLATAVIALAGLLWVAELLGTFGWFEAGPYVGGVIVLGGGIWGLGRGSCRRGGVPSATLRAAPGAGMRARAGMRSCPPQPPGPPRSPLPGATRGRGVDLATLIALAISVVALIHFAAGVKLRLSTGMTGFDSTWYHGPFAAGFFQDGDTWSLHFIAPQFLAWFYPANSEVLHAVGMGAFHRDLLSPLLNLGWFVGCLVAGWCIGRPYGVAPVSLALTAVALSIPALADQAGEARNDIAGIFFLLAAVAIALNAWTARSELQNARLPGTGGEGLGAASAAGRERSGNASGLPAGAMVLVGLAVGLAAGTKLNFLLPAVVLVAGLVAIAPRGGRGRALAVTGLAALAGGGYWYLRNLAQTGNPLPWIKHLGPINLPAPDQALGGREDHSVLGYFTDTSIWSDWFLPGLHQGLSVFWPLLGAMALAGLLLCIGRRADPVLRLAGLAGLAAAAAWLIAPTSASGPDGLPRGFESGLRYLAPSLVLGLALLPATPVLRQSIARISSLRSHFPPHSGGNYDRSGERQGSSSLRSHFPPHSDENYDRNGERRGLRPASMLGLALVALVAVAAGYSVQRHYLERRYADPSFTTPGLNAAFRWAQSIAGARIATTSTRQYPLYGKDLTNRVDYIGTEQPHGGFTPPKTCPTWRRLINAGNYDYVITSRDRLEPAKPTYPATASWTEAPGATVVLRKPPTTIFHLTHPLNPAACP